MLYVHEPNTEIYNFIDDFFFSMHKNILYA